MGHGTISNFSVGTKYKTVLSNLVPVLLPDNRNKHFWMSAVVKVFLCMLATYTDTPYLSQ
jgi:hypothetical protein